MKKSEWEEIVRAREVLGLGNKATLAQIKKAFRKLSKKYHPDTRSAEDAEADKLLRINEAYQLLLDYCAKFSFPLAPGEEESMDPEDWWNDRFGQDPLWSKSRD